VSEKTAQRIKDQLIKIYGAGLACFVAVFASITALGWLLFHSK
jgi:hypothetical protein